MARRKIVAQTQIPGTARTDINKQIEKAAEDYRDIRDRRMEMTKEENKAQAALVAAMNAAGLTLYRCDFDEQDVIIKPGEVKAKVKTRESKTSEETEDPKDH